MQQQLNTVLANQSAQEKKVNNIESNLNILSSNLLVVKETVSKDGDRRDTFFPQDGQPQVPQAMPAPVPSNHRVTSFLQAGSSREPPAPSAPTPPTWAERTQNPPVTQNSQFPPPRDKMLLVLDSIGHHARYDLIEGLTNTKIVTKKANCTLSGGRYPEANYNRVVTDTLKAHPDVKVLGINASACDRTNISPGARLSKSELFCAPKIFVWKFCASKRA